MHLEKTKEARLRWFLNILSLCDPLLADFNESSGFYNHLCLPKGLKFSCQPSCNICSPSVLSIILF